MLKSNKNVDHTPINFNLDDNETYTEQFKILIRKFIYPVYTYINNYVLRFRFSFTKNLKVNKYLLGHRGSDYASLRRLLNKKIDLSNKDILIIGCGTGRDLKSWLKYNPSKIVAVDLFNYDKAWNKVVADFKKINPNVSIEFYQQDINALSLDCRFDVIASDAVFEHLRNFDTSISVLKSYLKPSGVIYATFGPLWNCWGGDHIGGSLSDGYNHLLLDQTEYLEYLESKGPFVHHEGDGRTWFYNDLFSYLTPQQYLKTLRSHGLNELYVSCLIDQRAIDFSKNYPDKFKSLLSKHEPADLFITGMTVIYDNKS